MSDEEPFCTEHISEIREEYNRKTCTEPTRGEHFWKLFMNDEEPTREEHFHESCMSDEEPTREEHIRGIREEEKPFSWTEEEEEEEGTQREGDQERKRKRGAKYE